jgi:hypothetical protein
MKMDIEEIITELSMTYSFRMHLLLEGSDDKKFFQAALMGVENVNLLCAWGADNVTELIRRIDQIRDKSGFAPALGIIDRDYRIPLGAWFQSDNLLCTDRRDLECMMFDSPSFHTVLMELGSEQKLRRIGGTSVVYSLVSGAARLIGALRFHSQRGKMGVSFRNLDINRLIDKKSLTIGEAELVGHLNNRQGVTGCVLPADSLERAFEACNEALCNKGNPYFVHELLLCRGHDLMEILAVGFRSLIGSRSATESSREIIESMFRLSYLAHFKSTELARSIEEWLIRNGVHPDVCLV